MIGKIIEKFRGDRYYKRLQESAEELKTILSSSSEKLSQIDNSIIELRHRIDDIENDQISRLNLISENIAPLKYCNLELLNIEKSKKKRLLIVGFYGAPNLGDELMLETLLSYLCKTSGLQITIMLWDNPNYDTKKFSNITFVHYPKSTSDLDQLVDYFDIIMFGGGAIIDDSEYNEKSLNYKELGTLLIEISLRAIASKKKLICYGLSTNKQLNKKEYVKYLSKIAKEAEFFSVRDKNSFETLKKLGIPTRQIRIVKDLVLASQDLKCITKEKHSDGEIMRIGLNLMCDDYTRKRFPIFVKQIRKFATENKYKEIHVTLIPFYEYLDIDSYSYKNLIEEYNCGETWQIAPFANTMKDLVDTLMQQDVVIAMRYHCSLISGILGLPTMAVCYDKHPHYLNKITALKDIIHTINIQMFSALSNSVLSEFLSSYSRKSLTSYDTLLQEASEEMTSLIKEYIK